MQEDGKTAEFRFYEELNDLLPMERSKQSFIYGFWGEPAIKDGIEAIGVTHTEVDLILVNGVSVGFEYRLQPGDQVSVYPVRRDLIQVARVDDFIISDRLVSLALTQLSENKRVLNVFQDLLNPEGSEIYLKPVEGYLRLDQPVNFYTVLEAARQCGEVAIGYRLNTEANDAANHYGIHLNPKKSQVISFSQGDRIISLAEKQ